jgi:hypothetical protein
MSRVFKGILVPSTDAEILAEFDNINGSGKQAHNYWTRGLKSTWRSSNETNLTFRNGVILHHPMAEETLDETRMASIQFTDMGGVGDVKVDLV